MLFLLMVFSDCNPECENHAEVIKKQPGPDFLFDIFDLFSVEMSQADSVFQLTKRGFNSPYADILEMPINPW